MKTRFSNTLTGRIVLTAASQITLGYSTLFIQAIYPVWSAPFWPASGAALAAVILGGPRMLLGIYLGLLMLGLKFFWGPYPLWMAFVVPWGNMMETAAGYFLLRYFVPNFDPSLQNIRHLAAFILLCPWVPALTSATSIQLLLQYLGTIPPDRFLSELAVYTLGNATGILLVTPLILVWRDFRSYPWKSPEGRKILGELVVVLTCLCFFYSNWAPAWGRLVAVGLIPLVVWGVWVTGIRGATLVCLLGSISYFALDIPGSRPLSTLLEEKQKSAELRFVLETKLHGDQNRQTPVRLARDISDQIGLLTVICITILPLGVAADELRNRAQRDRMAMAALSSSFWVWHPGSGHTIENPEIARLFPPEVRLFLPDKKIGTLKLHPPRSTAPPYVSHWVIQETDASGNPLKVTGILQNFSMEQERDDALAQARLMELEMQTLRSHLNPHLLFNCLTGLRGLITEDPAKAREFSGNLARFLRAAVDSQNQKTISLRQELEICEDFAQLEALRGRPTELQIHLGHRDGEILIPPLTLVTLLENATKHGIRKKGEAMVIEVRAEWPTPQRIRIKVRQPGHLESPTDGLHHAGLGLVRRNLEMVYAGNAHLELTETLPGYVVAQVELPA